MGALDELFAAVKSCNYRGACLAAWRRRPGGLAAAAWRPGGGGLAAAAWRAGGGSAPLYTYCILTSLVTHRLALGGSRFATPNSMWSKRAAPSMRSGSSAALRPSSVNAKSNTTDVAIASRTSRVV